MKLDTNRKIKVLYVEDEHILRERVDSCLKYFFDVTTAENGRDGFDKFCQDRFDLVITDILMLEKTGLELINDIRGINSEIPIIVASAFTDEYEEKLQPIKYLKTVKKPYEMRDLVENIKVLVA
jgi:YesN/AraC family two-component response regulator